MSRSRQNANKPKSRQKGNRSSLATISRSYPPSGTYPLMDSHRFNVYNQTFMVEGMGWGHGVISSTSTPQGNALYFGLFNLNNFTLFQQLFDEYRMRLVEVWLTPGFNTLTETSADTATWASAVDLDDATAPTNPLQVCQKPGCVITSVMSAHYHRWVPRASVTIYDGTIGSAFGEVPEATWLDTNDQNIQHYGLKLAIDPTVNELEIKTLLRFTFEFRGMRP